MTTTRCRGKDISVGYWICGAAADAVTVVCGPGSGVFGPGTRGRRGECAVSECCCTLAHGLHGFSVVSCLCGPETRIAQPHRIAPRCHHGSLPATEAREWCQTGGFAARLKSRNMCTAEPFQQQQQQQPSGSEGFRGFTWHR